MSLDLWRRTVAAHPGLIAVVNEETGDARLYLAPNTGLPSVTALEAERGQLLDMIDRATSATERAKLRARLNHTERDLHRARDLAETARRTAERIAERREEAGGQPSPSNAPASTNSGSLRDRLATLTRSVAALAASLPIRPHSSTTRKMVAHQAPHPRRHPYHFVPVRQ
jgi:hypothetical protein